MPRPSSGPGAIGAPAAQGEGGDDHGQQDEVAHRIGEVGGDTERVAADGVQHGLQDDRGAHGARGERGGQPVDPQRPRGALDPRAQQQAQPGEDERVEGEVAGVGDRRDGDDRVVGQHHRPVHVAARPQQRAHADEPPGGPSRPRTVRARHSVSSDAPTITIQYASLPKTGPCMSGRSGPTSASRRTVQPTSSASASAPGSPVHGPGIGRPQRRS